MANKRIKLLKNDVINYLNSFEFESWKILLSRKAFPDGAKHYAEVDCSLKRIIINPYKEFIYFVPSIVHEILHILYPRSFENTIKRWEKEVMTDMSPSETTALLASVFAEGKVIWDE